MTAKQLERELRNLFLADPPPPPSQVIERIEKFESEATRPLRRKLGKVELALFEYHRTLDLRKHGGVAQAALAKEIEKIFDKPWHRGATLC